MTTVLVVEDSNLFFEATRVALQALEDGVLVLHASTIGEAETLFSDNPDIDGIIMDGRVPGTKSTVALVEDMRKTFKGPIIAASGTPVLAYALSQKGLCNEATDKGPAAAKKLFELLAAIS